MTGHSRCLPTLWLPGHAAVKTANLGQCQRGRPAGRLPAEKSETRSLTLEDRPHGSGGAPYLTGKAAAGTEASSDIADIVDLMLAPGARIGLRG